MNEQKEIATTEIISDEKIASYAELMFKGDITAEEAFKRTLGFVPNKQQILEIESNPVYRDRLDSLVTFINAKMVANASVFADRVLITLKDQILETDRLIKQVLADTDTDMNKTVRNYTMLATLQNNLAQTVYGKILKYVDSKNIEKDDDEDIQNWEEIRIIKKKAGL